MTYAVYCITNELNGNQYVGATTFLERRIDTHFSYLKNGKHYSRLLQADYDENNGLYFSCTILERISHRAADHKYRLRSAESKWISLINPIYNTRRNRAHNLRLINLLGYELGKGHATIVKYLDTNHPLIQTPLAQSIIKQHA